VIGRPQRHQTLRDTIAWSYDLLPAEFQQVFRRLGVFAGGANLSAVRSVVATAEVELDPLDAVAGLVDVSLVTLGEEPTCRTRSSASA
jgi:predicted ATPase